MQFFRSVTNQFGGCLRDVELRGSRPQNLGIAGLGFPDDAVHHFHCFDRVGARGGFGREHQRVAAVKYGVGNVGRFRARGARVLRHGFEHLCRGDYRQSRFAGLGDDQLLDDRHFFRAHFHAQIAARDHYAVGRSQNRVQILNRLRLFELGNDRNILSRAFNRGLRQQHIFRAANEADGHKIRAMAQGEGQVHTISRGHRRNAQFYTGQVDALVFAQLSAVDDFAHDRV